MVKKLWRPVLAGLCALVLLAGGFLVYRRASAPKGVVVPILMYHHFSQTPNSDTTMTPAAFEAQLAALSQAGYTAVTFRQLQAYVSDGQPLPDRPVCITMDDGYLSNYEVAWPLLERYGMKATVFVIGSSVGRDTYKDSQFSIIPHFSWAQGLEMLQSGVMDIQCHTYDMHQWAPYESDGPVRANALPLEGESDEDYAAALTADLERFQADYQGALGQGATVLAYPTGVYNELTETLIHGLGFPITLSTDAGRVNRLIPGQPETLYALGRRNITQDITPEQLLALISQ